MYKFATERENFEDYSSGRVLLSKPNATNFPVRLASEIFQRCSAFLEERGHEPPYSIYDPLCGVGYALTVLGLLHGDKIRGLVASDRDETVLEIAEKNLNMVSVEGLEKRLQQLRELHRQSSKDSHLEAITSALRLIERRDQQHDIQTQTFQRDALDPNGPWPSLCKIDVVFVDLPYNDMTHWANDLAIEKPVQALLDNMASGIPDLRILAISANKAQKIEFTGHKRLAKFQLGKRRIVLIEPVLSGR